MHSHVTVAWLISGIAEAKLVFCIGGGETLLLEYIQMADGAIEYVVYDAVRLQEGQEIRCELLHMQAKGLGRPAGRVSSQHLPTNGMIESHDPRWDLRRFERWAARVTEAPPEYTVSKSLFAVSFVRVGYLRHCHKAGKPIGRRQDLPPSALHLGPPAPWVNAYHVIARWLTREHVDPLGQHLASLVSVFDKIYSQSERSLGDEDLVWWDYPCRFQKDAAGKLSPAEAAANQLFDYESELIYVCGRLRCIVLPDPELPSAELLRRGWIL